MKIHVKQMSDWNYYAYVAENVDEKYWDYFRNDFWWQVGNNFIKTYDNVKDFEYCAENFLKFGEISIKQQLKILPTPWKKALDLFASEIEKLNVDWFVHGSTAISIAFHNKELEPCDMNTLEKVTHNGRDLYISTIEMLKQDNLLLNRLDRVNAIAKLRGEI